VNYTEKLKYENQHQKMYATSLIYIQTKLLHIS